MYKYIVTWCIVIVSNKSIVTTDEFGRVNYNNDLLYRAEIIYDCEHNKEFYTKKEAFDFYNLALKESIDTNEFILFQDRKLSNVKIDSVNIKP